MPTVVEGPEGIARAVSTLGQGGVVAFPTETVYGLGADALNPDAVAQVYVLKGRPSTNPLIVHVSGTDMARAVVAEWTDAAQRLAETFWPGPLTIVLNKSSDVPGAVTADGPTVAVRCPDHPIALALIEAFGKPIVGPSANPSGRVSPTTSEHVERAFADTDLVILDGGPCRAGIESTVVDLTTDQPRVLRPGVISAAEISAALDAPADFASASDPTVRSPGLVGPHYQPAATVRLIPSADIPSIGSAETLIAWSTESHPAGGQLVRISKDIRAFASELYAVLHRADASGADTIAVELPQETVDSEDAGVRLAIMDRLNRAASESHSRSRRQ